MPCRGLGILIDTSVFVSWWDREPKYVRLMEIVDSEGFYVVVCIDLVNEYLRQMQRRFFGSAKQVLEYELQKMEQKNMLRWAAPARESERILNESDQAHLDCAHNNENPAHILVSDDRHFIDAREKCSLPIIITFDEFCCANVRETGCSEAKRLGVRRHGT